MRRVERHFGPRLGFTVARKFVLAILTLNPPLALRYDTAVADNLKHRDVLFSIVTRAWLHQRRVTPTCQVTAFSLGPRASIWAHTEYWGKWIEFQVDFVYVVCFGFFSWSVVKLFVHFLISDTADTLLFYIYNFFIIWQFLGRIVGFWRQWYLKRQLSQLSRSRWVRVGEYGFWRHLNLPRAKRVLAVNSNLLLLRNFFQFFFSRWGNPMCSSRATAAAHCYNLTNFCSFEFLFHQILPPIGADSGSSFYRSVNVKSIFSWNSIALCKKRMKC